LKITIDVIYVINSNSSCWYKLPDVKCST